MNNRSWIIQCAATGKYSPDCLQLQPTSVGEPAEGELLVKHIYTSLDPTSRNWLKLEAVNNYAGLVLGGVMKGQGLACVETSRAPGFARGDWVAGMLPWEERSVVSAASVQRLEPAPGVPLTAYLSVLSHIGRAAAIGLLEVAQLKASDAVLISGAAGATGSLASQIAKAWGCRTVGIAGGTAKCRYLLDELGLDGAIDHRSDDMTAAVRHHFPQGVDVFFDNVGGPTLDVVLQHMAIGARIAVCGAMSQYDLAPGEAPYGVKHLPLLIFRSARMEGFVVPQFECRYAEFDAVLTRLMAEGLLHQREHIVQGLEQAAPALHLLFEGRNEGKLMVQIAPEAL